jgi:hypothetical protein
LKAFLGTGIVVVGFHRAEVASRHRKQSAKTDTPRNAADRSKILKL